MLDIFMIKIYSLLYTNEIIIAYLYMSSFIGIYCNVDVLFELCYWRSARAVCPKVFTFSIEPW